MNLKIRRSGVDPSRIYVRLRLKPHNGSFNFRLTASEFFQHALFGFVVHHAVLHRRFSVGSLSMMP